MIYQIAIGIDLKVNIMSRVMIQTSPFLHGKMSSKNQFMMSLQLDPSYFPWGG